MVSNKILILSMISIVYQQSMNIFLNWLRLVFLLRLLQRCPLDYLKCNVIQPIIEQITPNCNLEHRNASASMMAFLQSLAKLNSNNKK